MVHEKPEQEKNEYFKGNHWELPTDLDLTDATVSALEKRLSDNNWEEDKIAAMSIGFRETLLNALIHGNLDLSDKDKEGGEETWHSLVKRKNIQTNKKVIVDLEITPEKAAIKIKDEGKGFDPNQDFVADMTSSEGLQKVTGRGLALMKYGFNKVSFDKEDRSVTLIKDRES